MLYNDSRQPGTFFLLSIIKIYVYNNNLFSFEIFLKKINNDNLFNATDIIVEKKRGELVTRRDVYVETH